MRRRPRTGQLVDVLRGFARRGCGPVCLLFLCGAAPSPPPPPPEGRSPGAAHQQTLEIDWLVGDLRDDPFRYNAIEAMWKLNELRGPALPALREALDSDDWQQRQLAAHLLRRMDPDPPTAAMLRVNIEALARDDMPYARKKNPADPQRSLLIPNAVLATRFLLGHVAAAEPRLVEGLESADPQQRFLCAFILATAGRDTHAAQLAAILLPHLADNDIPHDGLMAGSALYRLGPAVEPYLQAARGDADRQAGRLIDLILRDLVDPPDTKQKLWARSQRGLLSNLYHDPVYEYDFARHGHGFRGIGEHDR